MSVKFHGDQCTTWDHKKRMKTERDITKNECERGAAQKERRSVFFWLKMLTGDTMLLISGSKCLLVG
jgi:hypothetical protein